MVNILLVEDEHLISIDIKYTLEQFKYNVVGIFSNGNDVIKNVGKLNPDIILMDIMLDGDLDGIETGKRILAKHDIPIIFLTAYADSSTVESATKITPYGFILKPYDEKELHAAIEITLIKHKSELELLKSKAQYESMFIGNPEPCVYVDNDFKIKDINPRFKKFFGFTLEECKAKKIDDLIIPPGHKHEANKLSIESLSGSVFTDTVRKSKKGEILPVAISAAPIVLNGNIKGAFVIYKDIRERKKIEEERENLIKELQKTLEEVKTLEGLIPICSHCKKIRDDSGYWGNVEQYIAKHSNVNFSHGICPDCLKKYYPDQYKKMKEKGKI
ncbi:MAG: response regulator [Candidatus Tenebribacter davisii]|jgi:PAS domain S-box-containing protein|nr:response regulator [Candidatus Tenebribacter davisii]